MSVGVLIQHHPSRAHLLPGLLERLSPLPVQVVCDPQPDSLFRSPWRSYHACLEAFPDDAEHVLVIQDDATVCLDLAPALPAIVEAGREFAGEDPLIALALFRETDPVKRQLLETFWQRRTVSPRFFEPPPEWLRHVPTVATIWPKAARDAFLAVAPTPYMGHGTLPDVPNPPLVRIEPAPGGGHIYVFVQVDDEDALDASAFTTELGRLHLHDDELLHEHRHLLPCLITTLPALVSHRPAQSVWEPWVFREEPTQMYAGDEFSALEVFPA